MDQPDIKPEGKSWKNRINASNGIIIILVCLSIGLSYGLYHQKSILDSRQKELSAMKTRAEIAETESRLTDLYAQRKQEMLDEANKNLAGYGNLNKALTRYFVLENNLFLAEEFTPGESTRKYYLIDGDRLGEGEVSTTKTEIGDFPVIQNPEGKGAFSFNRLPDGLYKLDTSADYTEGYESNSTFIDAKNRTFLNINSASGWNAPKLSTQDATGTLDVRISHDDCVTSSQITIDGITWNGELVVKLQKPDTIKCYYSELGGIDVFTFFDAPNYPSRDLSSIVIPLENGKKLNIKFQGSGKPVFSLN